MWNFSRYLAEPLGLNIEEDDKEYRMIIHPPSDLKPEDSHVEVRNGMLSVSGQHSETAVSGGARRRSSHRFRRSTILPDDVAEGQIKAQFQSDKANLVITLPKEERHVTKRLRIQVSCL